MRHFPRLPFHLWRGLWGRLLAAVLGVMIVSWGIGILGYQRWGGLGFVDAAYNAAMILAGMGPVNDLETDEGKIFASLYALFSGVIFLLLMAIVLGPVLHRILHWFHLDEKDIASESQTTDKSHATDKVPHPSNPPWRR